MNATPGPYKLREPGAGWDHGSIMIDAPSMRQIGGAFQCVDMPYAEKLANAKLFTASWSLLAAAKALLERMDREGLVESNPLNLVAVKQARAAIAEAEDRS